MTRLPLAAALAALLVAAPGIASAGPRDGDRPAHGMGAGRGGPRHGPLEQRLHRQHRKMLRVLRMLELTDAQRQLVAEGSALAAPVRHDLRARIQAIFEDARTSPRTQETRAAVRAQVKQAVQSALASLEAPARKFLEALTPEQKAKLEAKAKEHGKTFDEQKLLKGFEGMLLAPKHGGHGPRGGNEGAGERAGPGRHGRGAGFRRGFRGGEGR